MKALILLAIGCLAAPLVHAQIKAPSDYFRKDSPGVPGRGGAPAAPGNRPPATPAVPAVPKFKDLPVNSQFYFLSDTNRAYAWTKISDASAKNSKNGVTQTINGATPVQR